MLYGYQGKNRYLPYMINKPLPAIQNGDFFALVGHTYERDTIEFKTALDLKTTGQKKEFLADVSSFANASGGDLVYGIEETGGKPLLPLVFLRAIRTSCRWRWRISFEMG
jgi:hypothetical protein